MSAALELSASVGKAVACRALGVPRATLYRHMQPAAARPARPTPARALDAVERHTVLDHLHSERFSDKAPQTGRPSKNRCRLEGRCFPGMKGRLIPSSCWSDRSSRTWSMCPQLNRSSQIGENRTPMPGFRKPQRSHTRPKECCSRPVVS
jgi:hypothetical protein